MAITVGADTVVGGAADDTVNGTAATLKTVPMLAALLAMVTAATTLFVGNASAAEITRRGDSITITGKIDNGDDLKFGLLSMEWPPRQATVILNSRGGFITVAASIGNRIRTNGYETRVNAGALCSSACAMIWIAGQYRYLDRRAKIGVHSAQHGISGTTGKPGTRADTGNAAVARWLTALGVPQQVIDLWPKADPKSMNYISYEQANAWGLLVERPK